MLQNELDEGGVGWSDDFFSDLNWKPHILSRCVFLAQSHQICGSELENPSGGKGTFPPHFGRFVWEHFNLTLSQRMLVNLAQSRIDGFRLSQNPVRVPSDSHPP